ncbi:MAG: VWA domain-containing protein, partial [Gemmatimonadota bacterium]|nr:VWA domain-containing protein [Gemmatimonadota bacterium]
MSFEFGQPSFLALLSLLPVWWWWVRPKGLAGLLIARGEPAEALALRGWRARTLETLPSAMRLAALGFLVLALCQPRIVRILEEPLTEGVGIAFAIDLSTSMWAGDMAERTTRLQAAKATVLRFLENREDDVGLVSFAGESLIRLPMTHDAYVVEMAVDEMEVGLLTDGTDIAGAIAAGAGLLRDAPHTSKVLILVTDGAHNKAGIVPAIAARAAAAFDVKVYPIAIGD